jgi:hypothetical protein
MSTRILFENEGLACYGILLGQCEYLNFTMIERLCIISFICSGVSESQESPRITNVFTIVIKQLFQRENIQIKFQKVIL